MRLLILILKWMKSTVQGMFFGAAFCIEEVQCMCNAFSGIDKCDKLAELLACLLKANDKFGAHCTFLSESIEQLFRKSQSSIFNYYLEITPTNSMRMMCYLHLSFPVPSYLESFNCVCSWIKHWLLNMNLLLFVLQCLRSKTNTRKKTKAKQYHSMTTWKWFVFHLTDRNTQRQ